MIIILSTILYFILTLSDGLNLIDLPQNTERRRVNKVLLKQSDMYEPYPRHRVTKTVARRYWLLNENNDDDIAFKAMAGRTAPNYEDEADANLKSKISTLVNQTMHDTQRKMTSIETLKNKYRDQGPYRAGFVLSLIKKSRDVLNELFNVAVKHRDEWKALEQLKIFELIVHTNVDTTNLLRQLVEIHLTHMNSTQGIRKGSKRVLLI
ncbi:uncharacterized protein LOC124634816 [Helicoverpa zea]|nr:uncharacterized protein LOC110378387 [Helicoverpa armigera]XP_047026410.1 uncharacterized protein LOC124634816 [Helicoverpa zea]